MSTSTAKTASNTNPVAGLPFAALFSEDHGSMEAVSRAYASLFGNVARTQAEMLRFMSDRFAKDAKMLGELAACKNPTDMIQLQVKLGSDVIADYVAETQRLMHLFESAAADGIPTAR